MDTGGSPSSCSERRKHGLATAFLGPLLYSSSSRMPQARTRHDKWLHCRKMGKKPWRYRVYSRIAIVGSVPDSFPNAILAQEVKPADISVHVARHQHNAYRSELSSSVATTFQLPPNDELPDSVFVEDPVVVISSKTAFMARAGHPNREGEGAALRKMLEEIGISVVQAPHVRLDGGDVLKAGPFYFVGLSERTERSALVWLQHTIEENFHLYGSENTCGIVVPIRVASGLHLKSFVTWVGSYDEQADGFLLAMDSEEGRTIVRLMTDATRRDWDVVWVAPEEAFGANVLFIPPESAQDGDRDGAILVQETCTRLRSQLAEKVNGSSVVVRTVDISEFVKANGSLTCMSIIL